MNEKKRLKLILLGVVILTNIAVICIVLSNPNNDIISELKNETEEILSEDSNISDKEVDYTLEYDENSDDSYYEDSSESTNINNNNNNSNSGVNANINNNNNNSNSGVNANTNNDNNNSNSGVNTNTNNDNDNSKYQNEVVEKDKGYMNINESREYVQEILDKKYSENGGIYINSIHQAYMLDGSLRTEEGHIIYYIGYFLNDEKPSYNGLNNINKLYRVATVNSITKEYTDFGYKNGRTYEELGFRTGPK